MSFSYCGGLGEARPTLKTPVPLIQLTHSLGEEVDAVGDVFFVGHFDDLVDVAGGDGDGSGDGATGGHSL